MKLEVQFFVVNVTSVIYNKGRIIIYFDYVFIYLDYFQGNIFIFMFNLS